MQLRSMKPEASLLPLLMKPTACCLNWKTRCSRV
uniref:Uncharacterized protein n=1 Tax=Rhizophora mucronata TaxID=61149 RepID=A0A2P2J5L9_RHIMU